MNPTPHDAELVEKTKEKQRMDRCQFEIWANELVMGIVLGLAFVQFAHTELIPALFLGQWDLLIRNGPLVLLYCWAMTLGLLYWYGMRLEKPIEIAVKKKDIGFGDYARIGITGFLFYQAMEVVTPNFHDTDLAAVPLRSAMFLGFMGLLIVPEFIGTLLGGWSGWVKVCRRLADHPNWRSAAPGLQAYFCWSIPLKHVLAGLFYLGAVLPWVIMVLTRSSWLTSLGPFADPWIVTLIFVGFNVGLELLLSLARKRLATASFEHALELARQEAATTRGNATT